jgi:Family of unknown function (DUF5681)
MREDGYFRPGQSGNPKGQPEGSRRRFSEAFLAELAAAFEAPPFSFRASPPEAHRQR